MIDSSNIRAHQHAAGAIGGQEAQALGRSRGGFGTKIHVKVDALGMPLCFKLTSGERHESQQAIPLISSDDCEYLLADKAYDNGELRDFLSNREVIAVIPSKNNRLIPIPHDKHIYKERNCIERFLNRIKQFRRIATRYDKIAITFMGAILVTSILIWLKG
jgi:transposase